MLINKIDSSVPAIPSTASAGGGLVAVAAVQSQSPVAGGSSPPRAEPTAAEVAQAVKASNESVRAVATNLEFAIDPGTKTLVVRLLDTSTHEVIRQVPSPEMLRIAQSLDQLQGLLLHTEA